MWRLPCRDQELVIRGLVPELQTRCGSGTVARGSAVAAQCDRDDDHRPRCQPDDAFMLGNHLISVVNIATGFADTLYLVDSSCTQPTGSPDAYCNTLPWQNIARKGTLVVLARKHAYVRAADRG